MELDRPLRIALRPCQVSAPTVASLNEEIVSKLKKRVLRQLFQDRSPVAEEAHGIWGYKEEGPLGREWSKLQLGDLLLFYAKKTFFARSYITALTQNVDAAQAQWPDGGKDYPCLMVYASPIPFRLKLERFNEIVRFKPAFRPQGFRALSEQQSALVSAACNLGEVPDRYRAWRLDRAMPPEVESPLADLATR
jgi:hypothetical protein